MKFKNEKNTVEGQEARIISITDKSGETLALRFYVDGKPQAIFSIYQDGAEFAVAMTRDKAEKLARAIDVELNSPIVR